MNHWVITEETECKKGLEFTIVYEKGVTAA
jgi:hypothetical protein